MTNSNKFYYPSISVWVFPVRERERLDPPAQGGWANHIACRGHRWAGGRHRRRWRSRSSVSPGCLSFFSCPAQPCSLRRCLLAPPPSPLPRWTPHHCPWNCRHPRSLSFCAAPVTTGSFDAFSPGKKNKHAHFELFVSTLPREHVVYYIQSELLRAVF